MKPQVTLKPLKGHDESSTDISVLQFIYFFHFEIKRFNTQIFIYT